MTNKPQLHIYPSSEEIFNKYGCKTWTDMYRVMAANPSILSTEDANLMAARTMGGEHTGALLLSADPLVLVADRLLDISAQFEVICDQLRSR